MNKEAIKIKFKELWDRLTHEQREFGDGVVDLIVKCLDIQENDVVKRIEQEMHCEKEKTRMCVKCGYERKDDFHKNKCDRGIRDNAWAKAIKIIIEQ